MHHRALLFVGISSLLLLIGSNPLPETLTSPAVRRPSDAQGLSQEASILVTDDHQLGRSQHNNDAPFRRQRVVASRQRVLKQMIHHGGRGAPKRKPRVVVQTGTCEILDKVAFEPGHAQIKEASFATLNAVAATLKGNPQIQQIEIQGHGDGSGDGRGDLKLSQQQADAVRSYLIEKGVAPDRLTAKGFGDAQPLDPSQTDAARAKNRRIEFLITDRLVGPVL